MRVVLLVTVCNLNSFDVVMSLKLGEAYVVKDFTIPALDTFVFSKRLVLGDEVLLLEMSGECDVTLHTVRVGG